MTPVETVSALVIGTMLDANVPVVVAMAQAAVVGLGATNPREDAVRLYYAVRDGLSYDPYGIDLFVDCLKASRVLNDGFGWCEPKAALLEAACRAVGIPARVGLADVRNHLSTQRLREAMGTDVFMAMATRRFGLAAAGSRPHLPSTSRCAKR